MPWASILPSYKITSFCIAAFIAGVAGGLYAHVLAFIQPDSFSFTKELRFLGLLVCRGFRISHWFCCRAPSLLTILPEVLRFLADWRLAVYAADTGHCDALSLSEGLCGGKEVPFMRISRVVPVRAAPLFGSEEG